MGMFGKGAEKSDEPPPPKKSFMAKLGLPEIPPELQLSDDVFDLFRYIVFAASFTIITFVNRPGELTYYLNANLKDLILDEEIEFSTYQFEMTFFDAIEMHEMWDWMQDVLMAVVYDTDVPGTYNPNGNLTAFLGVNYLLGGMRFRQIRTRLAPCESPPGMNITECIPAYDAALADEFPYGPIDENDGMPRWRFEEHDGSMHGTYTSLMGIPYNEGGYMQYFGLDGDAATEQLAYLRDNDWIDKRTRVVFIDLPLYNSNLGLFSSVSLILEYIPGGGITSSTHFRSIRMLRYETFLDYFVFGAECLFCLFLVYYGFEEVKEIREKGPKDYFLDGWNVLDWINIGIFAGCIAIRISWLTALADLNFGVEAFSQIHGVVYMAKQEVNLNAINAFCVYFKTFKYLGMVPGMDQLFNTLGNCMKDLVIFTIMLIVIYAGFVTAYFLTFSLEIPEYMTMGNATISLLRMLLGDFDFDVLYRSNRPMTIFLFFSYVLLVSFMLLNMFLAILNDSYAEVKSQVDTSGLDLGWKDKVLAFWRLIKRQKQQLDKLNKSFDAKAEDGEVDMGELQEVIDTNAEIIEELGMTEDVQALMKKFDLDGDGTLDRKELKEFQERLEEGARQMAITKAMGGAAPKKKAKDGAALMMDGIEEQMQVEINHQLKATHQVMSIRDRAAVVIQRAMRAYLVRKHVREGRVDSHLVDKGRHITIGKKWVKTVFKAPPVSRNVGWHQHEYDAAALLNVPLTVARLIVKMQSHLRGVKVRRDLAAGLIDMYRDPYHSDKKAKRFFKFTDSGDVIFTNLHRLPVVKETLEQVSYKPADLQGILTKTYTMMDRLNHLTTFIVEQSFEERAVAQMDELMDTLDVVTAQVMKAPADSAPAATNPAGGALGRSANGRSARRPVRQDSMRSDTSVRSDRRGLRTSFNPDRAVATAEGRRR